MYVRKPGSGFDEASDNFRIMVGVLRDLARHQSRVTLDQLVQETGLEAANVEAVMGEIERAAPLTAKRLVEPGPIAWDV